MYNIIISSLIAIVVFGLTLLIPYMHWGFGILIAVVSGFAAMIVLSRRIMKKLEPKFTLAQKQAQARQFKLAIATLEELLPYTPWQVMLKQQIHSQIGVFHYAEKREDEALEHLSKGSVRMPDAQLILASIYFRRDDMEKVKSTIEMAIRFNKKQILLYHAYAFMLSKKNQNEAAIEMIQQALKIDDSNETSKDNLQRLQNNKKMNMKPFGMNWFTLQLEKPPLSMMQDQFSGRPGFRQPKRRKM